MVAILFARGSSLEVKFPGQHHTLIQESWPPENSNLRLSKKDKIKKYKFSFPSSLAYQPLPQKTLSWAEILDRQVHFFIVV